ncbi:unnamed protein product [Xylocopa violacea]|uniref:Sensory neuron membrane protein 2 n=1 Tax=Xylocopa violacea TaxID=135666 RepID=A0ABP1NXE8_XYLVO
MHLYPICGIFWIIVGSVVIHINFFSSVVSYFVIRSLPLVDGEMYKIWSSPIPLYLSCYVFNVTNPDEVMQGQNPKLVEYGPIVYDEIYEKQVMDVDEELDEIVHTTTSKYTLNKKLSVPISRHDKVTVLNPAYIGAISMLTSLPPDFLKKYGDHIPKLFPNQSSIFLTVRPTDILFDGVKVSCNEKKYPELKMICETLDSYPSPAFRRSEKPGVYYLSMFQRTNGTIRGPFTVNRGLRNISRLGDITSYKGRRIQTVWNTDDCNTVKGTDTITWAPLIRAERFVTMFTIELCRSLEADYVKNVSSHGINGLKYAGKAKIWYPNNTKCFCQIEKDVLQCLPQGLVDIYDCQKMPGILSEPHFLHADPSLLTYAEGLYPNESLHETYIVIEPYTGAPLSGSKKIQVNLKLEKLPVKLLSNVSEGYFPIVWCANVRSLFRN